MIKTRKQECSICRNRDFHVALEMPKFPFTGIYLRSPEDPRYKGVDQNLLFCPKCGHAQLQNVLDPTLVYDNTYTHRSSASEISRRGNDFFQKYLEKICGDSSYKRILEIGCNDFYLLKKIEDMGDLLFGLDPIWKTSPPPELGPKIKAIGRFVEELDFKRDLGGRPDLIISAHTFEHVENPREQLEKLVDIADSGALFIIEVPGFDSLLRNCRFDQVFHQHIQYYSLSSFERLIHELGCDYVDHSYNYNYWGGTMLVAFRKNGLRQNKFIGKFKVTTRDFVNERLQMFKTQLNSTLKLVNSLNGESVCGFGAAQMLPTVAYHMHTDFGFMKCVYDDNSDRDGLMYPYMPIKIRRPEKDLRLDDVNILVTALDSSRPLVKRAVDLGAKRIFVPLNVL